MIKLRTLLTLFPGPRKSPVGNGYRPLFNFVPSSKISGSIALVGREQLVPGEACEAIVSFLSDKYMGEFRVGDRITFDEGREPFGECQILSVLENTNEFPGE